MKELNTSTITAKSGKLLEELLDQTRSNLTKDLYLIFTDKHGAWECPKCSKFVPDLGKLRQRIEPWRQKKRIIIHCATCDVDKYSDGNFRLVGDFLAPLRLSMVSDLQKHFEG